MPQTRQGMASGPALVPAGSVLSAKRVRASKGAREVLGVYPAAATAAAYIRAASAHAMIVFSPMVVAAVSKAASHAVMTLVAIGGSNIVDGVDVPRVAMTPAWCLIVISCGVECFGYPVCLRPGFGVSIVWR
jgi:hypothetical protein